jgi:hypothetical protein
MTMARRFTPGGFSFDPKKKRPQRGGSEGPLGLMSLGLEPRHFCSIHRIEGRFSLCSYFPRIFYGVACLAGARN